MTSNPSRAGPKLPLPRIAKSSSFAHERIIGTVHEQNVSSKGLTPEENTFNHNGTCSSSEKLLLMNHSESVTKQTIVETPNLYPSRAVQFDYCPYPVRRDGREYNAMFIPFCLANNETCEILRTASPLPPTTLSTIAELELNWVRKNIDLRVDINHEHDLRFMPIKGEMGQQRREQAKMYWDALELELEVYRHNSCGFCSVCSQAPPATQEYFVHRLPIMFETLKELLALLVPDRDQDEVSENLDVDLLVQQVRHRVLDIVRLATWLEGLLTSHCAPIRDEQAGEMRAKLIEGASQDDTRALVDGLQQLFSFLETMKLDVANHQIKRYRLLLIEETISWQKDYFVARIQEAKFDVTTSRNWYLELRKKSESHRKHEVLPENFLCLLRGLVEITAFAEKEFPATFTYDFQRLEQMQTEVQDIIHIGICLREFDKVNFPCHSELSNLSTIQETLKISFMYLTDAEPATNRAVPDTWLSQVEPIAIEIDRARNAIRGTAELPERYGYRHIVDELSNAIEAERVGRLNTQKCFDILMGETARYATQFWNLTPLQMAEKQRLYQLRRQESSPRHISDIVDVARKLADIGVLHWRVWERLAYIQDEDMGDAGQESKIDVEHMDGHGEYGNCCGRIK